MDTIRKTIIQNLLTEIYATTSKPLTLKETAEKLGVSIRTFHEIRVSHPFYAHDGSRVLVENPKKNMPLWSAGLVRLITFARTLTEQGVRQLTDDEGLDIRKKMNERKREVYIAFLDT